MFTDPEVQIPACRTVGLKIASARERQSRPGRRSEVRGASYQPRNIGSNAVQNFGGRVAPGNSLGIGWKDGNVFRPIRGQLSLLNLVELCREFRIFLPILLEFFLPLLARFAASSPNTGFEVLIHSVRYEKLGVWRPAISLLRELDLFFAEWLAMNRIGVLAMRRAISDMAVNNDKRRPARRARGIPQRVLNPVEIVGIAYASHVPSVSQKPPRHVFGERDIGLAFDGDVVVVVDPAEVVELQVSCN